MRLIKWILPVSLALIVAMAAVGIQTIRENKLEQTIHHLQYKVIAQTIELRALRVDYTVLTAKFYTK